MTRMRYRTVGEVAELTGVTVRALHHYDEIGVLTPSGRTRAGYRLYSDADVVRLHAITNWRDMGFALAEIAALLDDSDTDLGTALEKQRERLLDRADRLAEMIEALDRAIKDHERGSDMPDERVREIFGGFDPSEHEDEAADRWGETEAYAEAGRRTSAYTADDWARYRRETDENVRHFARLMQEGSQPGSSETAAAARRHGELIHEWFYPITPEIHVGLADSYVADPRFAANYERHAPGLARYVRDAIVALYD